MSQQREDVVLEIATMLLTEQHSQILQRYHNHVLFLQDAFFSAEQQKQESFDLACTFLLLPVATPSSLTSAQIEEFEQRWQCLVRMFETTCQDEIKLFRSDGDALKQQMNQIIAVSGEKWKKAERRRQDDFMEMSIACQKEVAAITAELQSGVLRYFQDSRMSTVLEEALRAKVDEMRELNSQLEELTELRLKDFTEHQKTLQEEREKYRQRFISVQQETSKTVEELTIEIEERQKQYMREVREMQRQHTSRLEVLEKQLEDEREEREAERKHHTEEMDRYRSTVKKLEEERTQLTQGTVELQTQIDEWRRRYSERDSQAKMELIEYQTLAEALRVEEAQEFRKQLVGAVRRGVTSSVAALASIATSPPATTTAMSGHSNNSISPMVYKNDNHVSPSPKGDRSFLWKSTANGVQSRNENTTGDFFSVPYKDESRPTPFTSNVRENPSSNPLVNLPVHTPTASYVKLMNLSEQLKRHIELQ
ncbi:uncharacterized protein TM35_000052880 [Trypanosoma theileri]|uniref:Uncharacterized protein n=1 Tax=Trypanosoma theileri TaxID=67003 RepID=A0A1X0P445_9TRYP|nr:uncharacterized protein TM35_000052880 [Trypanosoma theileri]ORC91692.1 hypothetical protein TM35_000052880 [Trypanosoma theileri]